MTQKRFKEIYPNIIRSNYCFTDNGEPIGDKEVVELLNGLHEENKRLKKDIQDKEEIIELYQGFCGKMDEKRYSDYEEATYNSLKVLKKNGIRIICNDKDITDDIGDVE